MPVRRGRWTTAAAAQARVVARMRERGHSLEELKKAGREGRLATGLAEDLFPDERRAADRRGRRRGDRPRAGADRADPRHPRHPAGPRAAARPQRRRGAAPLRPGARGRLPPRRLPAARPRLRAVDAADRRRRGAPLPPLRARADDPRRRPGAGDGRGDGETWPPNVLPVVGAAHRVPAQPLPALLPRAGRGRPHGERARRHGDPPRPGPGHALLHRPDRLHPLHRGGGRPRGARRGRALRRDRGGDAAAGGDDREDDRRRGDGRLPRRRRR